MNADKQKGYGISQSGKSDELKGRPTISGIDNYNTNTTLGQFLNYDMSEPTTTETKKKEDENKDVQRTQTQDIDFANQPSVTEAAWMTPDLVNYFGAMKDKSRIKKEMPWVPMPDLQTADATYYDPTRELAAQSEQGNIAAQALGQYAGSPQATSSRLANIFGLGAKGAADTLSKYNNMNVGLANQFAQYNANIQNQEQGLRNQATKEWFDKNAIANQQFLNAKIAADRNKRKAFETGWKNASNLALSNAMSEQYDIDPRTGTLTFQGGKTIKPEASETFNSLLSDYIEMGFDPKDAIQAAKAAMGQGTTNLDAILNATAKDGGAYVMGSMVFPPFFY